MFIRRLAKSEMLVFRKSSITDNVVKFLKMRSPLEDRLSGFGLQAKFLVLSADRIPFISTNDAHPLSLHNK
jgi:hypothetical protein